MTLCSVRDGIHGLALKHSACDSHGSGKFAHGILRLINRDESFQACERDIVTMENEATCADFRELVDLR